MLKKLYKMLIFYYRRTEQKVQCVNHVDHFKAPNIILISLNLSNTTWD